MSPLPTMLPKHPFHWQQLRAGSVCYFGVLSGATPFLLLAKNSSESLLFFQDSTIAIRGWMLCPCTVPSQPPLPWREKDNALKPLWSRPLQGTPAQIHGGSTSSPKPWGCISNQRTGMADGVVKPLFNHTVFIYPFSTLTSESGL